MHSRAEHFRKNPDSAAQCTRGGDPLLARPRVMSVTASIPKTSYAPFGNVGASSVSADGIRALRSG